MREGTGARTGTRWVRRTQKPGSPLNWSTAGFPSQAVPRGSFHRLRSRSVPEPREACFRGEAAKLSGTTAIRGGVQAGYYRSRVLTAQEGSAAVTGQAGTSDNCPLI